ncbi:sugar ABC transporter substrate-binding protein [Brachybacterium sp. SGAir0954]|uniref:ABC transporter substrate-binding protein n=1 Tax=Brachybacterium sp. SGAir0954 TaxID=2571029 RepID=UPI0010CD6B15|nr:extracellular solute-binding protein [Brachybacterium sp. SGAir0954]QCR52838.1 sugar ABC transporter substrate-binding protein [Brachybacterium sp. SGAir0954]
MRSPRAPRRSILTASLLLGGLAACGPNAPGGSGASDAAALRFAWWGNAKRDELTKTALETYGAAHDGAAVSPETTDWSSYWDKLATQVAGGDVPDVLQMDEGYLAEYSSRGILADLGDSGLATDGFDPTALDAGTVEGSLVAVNAGINAPVLLANPAVFEAAGVDLPDDTTWTWDDLVDIATRITEGTEEGTYGVQQLGIAGDPTFSVHLRQQGAQKFDGNALGFTEEHLLAWFELALRLQDTKAAPPADVAVEEAGQAVDQTLFATGKCGLQSQWSNQVVTFDASLDGAVTVLRMPSLAGAADQAQLWYKASMYFAVSARSGQQEAAVALVDWLVNSEEAGRILLAERGVPANLDVREAILPELTEADLKAADFIEAIAEELGEQPSITPPGGSAVGDVLQRGMEDVLFGRVEAADAASSVLQEASGALG